MAHTFGSTVLARSSAATSPISRSATTVAGDTVLVLVLDVKGGTNRAGGAPTWSGLSGTQANTTQKAITSPEASIEIWDRLAPFLGTANVVIPNTLTATIFSAAYTGQAATDRGSAFDVAAGQNATSANPGTSLDTNVAGDIVFAATAGGWQAFAPTARTGTALYETDDGATGGGAQYRLQPAVALTPMTWTFATSDDWGAVAVAFKETLQPTPAPSGLTLTGTLSALALTMGLAAGSLGLTGPAPSLQVSSPVAPTIGIQVGTLQFKGPARPTTTAAVAPSALALTGPAPTVTLFQGPVLFTPDAGSLSLSGVAPGVPSGQLVPVPVGTLILQGPARPGALAIDLPSAGALTLTGQAPTLVFTSSGSTIAIGAGTLVLSGPVPLAARNQLLVAIPAATLRFQGPAGPGGPYTIAVGAGALTLAGPVPTRVSSGQTVSIPIPLGPLTLSGLAPQGFAGAFLTIPVGTLTLTGQYVAQAFDWGQPAALVLTGHAPAVLLGTALLLPVGGGGLTLSGPAPVALVQPAVPVGLAVLTLNGLAPQLTLSNPSGPTLAPNPASLTFTGTVPSLLASESAYVPPGALTVAGWAPQLSIIDPSVLTGMVSIPRRERVAVIRGREHLT